MFLYHKAHSQKFYERSPNKKASKLLKVSFIDEKTQKMKKNKFLHNLIENKGDRKIVERIRDLEEKCKSSEKIENIQKER